MKLVKIVILVFSFIFCSDALTQEYIDLVKIDYAYAPASQFENSTESTTLQVINGDFTYPIKINDDLNLLTGVSFENFYASFDPNRKEESIFGITAKLGVNITHNDKWSGTYMLLPKISSDLENISNRDFQLGGIILMKYTKSDHFNYKFGVYANNELFGPLIVPVFGFYYINPSEKFEAKVLAPLALDLNYSFTNSARIGLNFNGQIRTYDLSVPGGSESDRYLQKASNDLYAYFQYEMKNGLNFQVSIGRAIGRSYRIYNEKISFALPLAKFGDDRTQLNNDFSDSWIFKVGVFYRYKYEKSNNQ